MKLTRDDGGPLEQPLSWNSLRRGWMNFVLPMVGAELGPWVFVSRAVQIFSGQQKVGVRVTKRLKMRSLRMLGN